MATESKKDPWSWEELMACEYCKGAAYIFRPCKVHGGTPWNTYFEIQRMRSMQEWECERCHEKGWNDTGEVPYVHLCPDKRPKPLDLSPFTNLAYKPPKSIIGRLDEMDKEACYCLENEETCSVCFDKIIMFSPLSQKLRESVALIKEIHDWRGLCDEDSVETFDRIANMFYKDTHEFRPGKSVPLAMYRDENDEERRQTAWAEWVTKKNSELDQKIRTYLNILPPQ